MVPIPLVFKSLIICYLYNNFVKHSRSQTPSCEYRIKILSPKISLIKKILHVPLLQEHLSANRLSLLIRKLVRNSVCEQIIFSIISSYQQKMLSRCMYKKNMYSKILPHVNVFLKTHPNYQRNWQINTLLSLPSPQYKKLMLWSCF